MKIKGLGAWLPVLLGEAAAVGLTLGGFFLAGRLSGPVLLGAVAGGALAVGNFLAMAWTAGRAADRAGDQDPRGAGGMMYRGYFLRMVLLAGALFALAASGWVDVLALGLPLLLMGPVLHLVRLLGR